MLELSKIILGIDDALRTSYPTNQYYGQIWMRKEQKKFKGKTPLSIILRNKIDMKRVWHFLDCIQSWQ